MIDTPLKSGMPLSLQLRVEALSAAGQGIAHYQDKPVLIEGALPGEEVTVTVIAWGRNFHRARMVAITKASDRRVEPSCPYFETCGGCQSQHLDAVAQRDYKQRYLAELFSSKAGIRPRHWRAPLFAKPYAYRRRARLGVRHLPGHGVVIGFRRQHRSYIHDIESCTVLESRLSALLPALHELVPRLDCSRRLPQVEVAAGEHHIAAVFRHLVPLSDHDRKTLTQFAEAHGVQVYTQAGGPQTARLLSPADAPALYYALPEFDLKIEFAPTDFIQGNAAVNRRLVAQAVAALDIQNDDRVLELFAGLGNFTLAMARRGARVDAVEGSPGLIEQGRHNCGINHLNQVGWHCLDLFEPGVELDALFRHANKLILDPPREGAIEALKALPAGGVDRIVYISCNPKTLARDCGFLVHQKHFELVETGLVDMFPQTKHVEALAILQRRPFM